MDRLRERGFWGPAHVAEEDDNEVRCSANRVFRARVAPPIDDRRY